MDLLLLNILSYSLFDLWLNSTMTSVLLCYLLDYSIAFVRKSWGQVSQKRFITALLTHHLKKVLL